MTAMASRIRISTPALVLATLIVATCGKSTVDDGRAGKPAETERAQVVSFCGQQIQATAREVTCDGDAKDLTPLASLTQVERIDLTFANVGELTPLAGLASLEFLGLGNTQVSDLKPIGGLAGLRVLEVNHTQVTSLKPIAQLTSLEELYITGTEVTDLRPLSELPKLTRLGAESTAVTDLSPLEKLESLRLATLGAGKVAPEQIEALSKKLPHCQLPYHPGDTPSAP
jgi:Leucine-rich repeat (LRR) protein